MNARKHSEFSRENQFTSKMCHVISVRNSRYRNQYRYITNTSNKPTILTKYLLIFIYTGGAGTEVLKNGVGKGSHILWGRLGLDNKKYSSTQKLS